MSDLVFSIVMLGVVGMLAGAFILYRKLGPNRQSMLMVILAVVMFANVLIWSIPAEPGDTGGAAPGSAAR